MTHIHFVVIITDSLLCLNLKPEDKVLYITFYRTNGYVICFSINAPSLQIGPIRQLPLATAFLVINTDNASERVWWQPEDAK